MNLGALFVNLYMAVLVFGFGGIAFCMATGLFLFGRWLNHLDKVRQPLRLAEPTKRHVPLSDRKKSGR